MPLLFFPAMRSGWAFETRFRPWSIDMFRPRPALLLAWGVLAVFVAISQPFQVDRGLPLASGALFWGAIIAMRAMTEWLIRSMFRRDMNLCIAMSVVVEPVCVAIVASPAVFILGALAGVMEVQQIFGLMMRIYLVSLFISACEVMIVAARTSGAETTAAPARSEVIVTYYNERRITHHV